jgi:hypothetical protein
VPPSPRRPRPEHVAAHHAGADVLERLLHDRRALVPLAALLVMRLAPSGQRNGPVMQSLPTLAERVLLALVRAGDESVCRDRDVTPELAHRASSVGGRLDRGDIDVSRTVADTAKDVVVEVEASIAGRTLADHGFTSLSRALHATVHAAAEGRDRAGRAAWRPQRRWRVPRVPDRRDAVGPVARAAAGRRQAGVGEPAGEDARAGRDRAAEAEGRPARAGLGPQDLRAGGGGELSRDWE